MAKNVKISKELEERINFLKFELENGIASVRGNLLSGRTFSADETLRSLQEKLHQLFPFQYGSEMDNKGYSDKKVYLGK